LRKDYGIGEGLVRALDEVDLEIARGESVALTGSGDLLWCRAKAAGVVFELAVGDRGR
jgi:predicted ABC-type transport system involved in lysophospholipase L1 biosynthesis ATPase subunit